MINTTECIDANYVIVHLTLKDMFTNTESKNTHKVCAYINFTFGFVCAYICVTCFRRVTMQQKTRKPKKKAMSTEELMIAEMQREVQMENEKYGGN